VAIRFELRVTSTNNRRWGWAIDDVGIQELDTDGDGLPDLVEADWCTDPYDADTDDDGISDGAEDENHNGVADPGETHPCRTDTDGDGLQDGTESSITEPVEDPDGDGPLLGTNTDVFVPDADPFTGTDPTDDDTDDDGFTDGQEDTNYNGRLDAEETNPSDPSYRPIYLGEGFNLVAFPRSAEGYSAFQVLNELGSENVTSIQRYSPDGGAFETAGFGPDDELVGVDFLIRPGEGYIIYMKQEVLGF